MAIIVLILAPSPTPAIEAYAHTLEVDQLVDTADNLIVEEPTPLLISTKRV